MLTVEEIARFIEEDISSEKKHRARKGLDYYEGKHDILNYKLYYINGDGQLVEDTNRSNIKIPHTFFTELTDQQVQYMLSCKGSYIKSDDQELQAKLDEYFGEDFTAELQELLTGVTTKGFDYMYAYKGEDGKLHFQWADSMGVVEVEGKYTSDKQSYIIYWYIERINKDKKPVKRIQVWNEKETYYYTQIENGKIELDKEELNPRPHVIYDTTEYEGLGFIPFFRLDNNKKQTSNLKAVKALIDDYDLMSCGLSNNLQDASEYVVVVKGFEGSTVDEIQQNIKTKKAMGLPSDQGDVEFKTVDIPYQARQSKLDLDEKNIYRFGMGFNSAQLGDGNITNIVIKSRYALLDLKCNKLEIRLKQFLRKIIKVVLDEINREDKAAYEMKQVYFDFEREVITNAKDNADIEKVEAETQQIKVSTIQNLATTLGNDKVLEMICEILDIDYEEVKAKAPEKEDLDEFLKVDETINE